jgi:phosphoglycolate phosphatase-like HAD superfamily hydrolase
MSEAAAALSLIVFDVDGPLLKHTSKEDEAYLEALAAYGIEEVDTDWSSYPIKSDFDITKLLLERHCKGHQASFNVTDVLRVYRNVLAQKIDRGEYVVQTSMGAYEAISQLASVRSCKLGIATANFLEVAQCRLTSVGMWQYVSDAAEGSSEPGDKATILRRLLSRTRHDVRRSVLIGDSPADMVACIENGIHFVGMSEDRKALEALRRSGAKLLCESLGEAIANLNALDRFETSY